MGWTGGHIHPLGGLIFSPENIETPLDWVQRPISKLTFEVYTLSLVHICKRNDMFVRISVTSQINGIYGHSISKCRERFVSLDNLLFKAIAYLHVKMTTEL